ncbi:MAG: glycoside hydrolase family 127 protein [Clostridia bacterium]|nr:glycoside hydrolase family 127 protein [Clostridia bacterium]
MPAKPVFRRAPLMDVPFAALPLGAIRPEGWLRAQLSLQAEALRGALADRWPDLADGGAWRAPSEADWPLDAALLAAALPLGYLLGDAAWIGASRRRIEWALQAQREDGCLPPAEDSDEAWCARAGLMQVLQQHYAATADRRVLAHMLRYCKHALERLGEWPLGIKSAARASALLQPALWLYRVTEKKFLLELARALQAQSVDWTAFCHTMPYKKQLPWESVRRGRLNGDPYHIQVYQQTHAMNLAMGLKTPGLIAQFTGGIKHAEAFDVGYAKLMRHHGLANGLFSGEDLLGGASPSQGTMCAAISELMSTLESLLISLGTASHGDVLEKLAFNALPAAYSADMRAWQRVQPPNQTGIASSGRRAFTSALNDADLAALHHGFPRFAASLWMASKDGGLAAMSYAPCSVRARAGGGTVRIDVQTAYPFDGSVTLRVHVREALAFPLHLRIPAWAEGATATVGEERYACPPGAFAVLDRAWRPGDTVALRLPMQVAQSEWYHRSAALCRGPLLLAHAFETGKPWAYALLPGRGSEVRCDPAQAAPFGHGSPLVVQVRAVPLPEWGAKSGVAEAPPIAPEVGAAQAVALPLVPYGATALRVCQFPVALSTETQP